MTTEVRQHLIDRREELRLTQADVANAIGSTQQTVSRLESGSRKMTLEWVSKLAIALQWSEQEVLFGPSDKIPTKFIGELLPNEAVALSAPQEVALIEGPPGATAVSEFQAVEVKTETLEPRFFKGDCILFSASPSNVDDCIGYECLISLYGGSLFTVRRVEAGNQGDTVLLRGYRPSTPTITSASNAAILYKLLWVKPKP